MSPRTVPPELEKVFGRDDDVRAVVALLDGGARVVTLVGPGGVGKSTLAHASAREVAGDAHRVALEDVTAERALLRTLAKAAGLPAPPPRSEDPSGDLAASLAARGPALVILDDADAVLAPAARLVRATLVAGDGPRFLVTSREPLGIDGERVVTVGPLEPASARALFRDRAGGVTWDEPSLDAVIEALDGLPLALELAARRSQVLGSSELLARLGEVFRVLRTDRRDVAARHATLHATIAWSVARLPPEEARAFAALGVLAGAFDVEAFEAIAGPSLAGEPVDVLEALTRKSLVVAAPGASARFVMLRTVAAFARESFGALPGDEPAALLGRHASFFVARAEAAVATSYGPAAEASLDTLVALAPDLERASLFASDAGLRARAIVALGDPVVLRHVVDPQSERFDDAIEAADVAGDPALRTRARVLAAKVLLELARPQPALVHAATAVAIADEAGLLDDAADARRTLAWTQLASGDGPDAAPVLEAALAAHRGRSVRGEADALAARGLLAGFLGDAAAAQRDLDDALALHLHAGDAIRRDKVVEMGELLGLTLASGEDAAGPLEERIARLEAEVLAHHASGRVWREAIARHRLAALVAPAPEAAKGWTFGPACRWLREGTGAVIDLSRHAAPRLVLDALVEARLLTPGSALSADALLAAGWPGERVRHESGMLRVYTVVRRLRAMGLERLLVTRDDGYLLETSTPVLRAEGGAPA